ncbi:MAG: hypothetical protein HY303_05600 [Candidatus Wallbacteria bacterium]|nr:hypothetical protein [Candidatus Wallbacteria bacterium]
MDASESRFELTLLGYQFPDKGKLQDGYDKNWLIVRIDAKNPDGSWSAVDSALLTWDVAAIARWFRALSMKRPVRQLVDFTEIHLRFGCRSRTSDPVKMRIDVAYKFCPPWGRSVIVSGPYYGLDLDLSRKQLAVAAKELEIQLREFPPRDMGRLRLHDAIWCLTSRRNELRRWRPRRRRD